MKMKYLVILSVLAAVTAPAQSLNRNRSSLLNNRANRQSANASAASSQNANDRTPVTAQRESGTKSIKFENTDIGLVFQVYGELTGKTVLVDPNAPKATITLQPKADQVLTDEEKILALETVLEMNGIHLEPYGEKFVRAMPRKEVRKEGVPLILDPDAELGETTRVVSFMIQFKNISVEDAQKTLDNFKSSTGIIIGFERNNSLLLTDTEANVSRMREIARVIDISLPVLEQVFVRQIKNANANDIKTALEAIVQESQKDQTEAQKKGNVPGARSSAAPTPVNSALLGRNKQQPQAQVANQSVVMGISDADRGMIRGKVLILADERSNKLIIVTQKSNMDFFDKVIDQLDIETTPDTVVKVYRLKYADSEDVSDMINDLIGNSSSSKNTKGSQNQTSKQGGSANLSNNRTTTAAKKPANQRTGESKAGELSKENTTVLSDKRINGLVVMTDKELVPTIEAIIESMDIKLSQVLIETVIIEVGLGDGIETGVDWISRGKESVAKQKTDTTLGSDGNYINEGYYKVYTKPSTDDDGAFTAAGTATGEVMTKSEFEATYGDSSDYVLSSIPETIMTTVRDGAANYFSGGGYSLGGGANGGVSAFNAMSSVITNFTTGGGINMILKSDKLNLGAIINASKSDSRSKYIASPIIMTLDNKEAEIEATEMVYLFKGYQYSGSTYTGSPVKDYEQKELGITIKVTPKINPNGTVMLTLEEEYSQEGAGQMVDGANQATTVTRKMSADALLENNQTVIFAGLTTTRKSESETGIPFLQEIPWIGKWLFSSVSSKETRTELMVFMTPYVLDDASVAEAEAIRRKKSFSDARPWDDHGWSRSILADPVSKKEQMRRLKDEWKKQDEERQAKIAIEQEKLKRAKKLKEMSVEERDLWLKMHKEELEDEQREELEKKMLDPESQEALKKLAAEIREKKLKAANNEIEAAEDKSK